VHGRPWSGKGPRASGRGRLGLGGRRSMHRQIENAGRLMQIAAMRAWTQGRERNKGRGPCRHCASLRILSPLQCAHVLLQNPSTRRCMSGSPHSAPFVAVSRVALPGCCGCCSSCSERGIVVGPGPGCKESTRSSSAAAAAPLRLPPLSGRQLPLQFTSLPPIPPAARLEEAPSPQEGQRQRQRRRRQDE